MNGWWRCHLCARTFAHARTLATHLDEIHNYVPLGRTR